ncbi:MAG: hypothetical protein OXH84_07280 [Gammaproteobacteria bacterium]|nr:hypothetical protein [Gammaproteobacteria bacterium]
MNNKSLSVRRGGGDSGPVDEEVKAEEKKQRFHRYPSRLSIRRLR